MVFFNRSTKYRNKLPFKILTDNTSAAFKIKLNIDVNTVIIVKAFL